mgnify:CR=1 FL=1
MENKGILNGNHLKLIAAFTMLLDHAGILLFPRLEILRILGRIAFPIFAFMIAEGCRYTRNKLRYFLMVFGLGVACQLVYYVTSGDTYLNILLTFSCAILLIYLLQAAGRTQNWKQQFLWSAIFAAGVFLALGMTQILTIDYGFWGIMTPVFAAFSLGKGKTGSKLPVLMTAVGLIFLGADLGGIQHYALLAIPLLLLYNGQRGKANLKYFFYFFFPVHLAVLQGIAWLVR